MNSVLGIMLADILSNIIYKGYKEYWKFCWKIFKKGNKK